MKPGKYEPISPIYSIQGPVPLSWPRKLIVRLGSFLIRTGIRAQNWAYGHGPNEPPPARKGRQ